MLDALFLLLTARPPRAVALVREALRRDLNRKKEHAMSFETILGLVLAAAALVYLLYALLKPEKL